MLLQQYPELPPRQELPADPLALVESLGDASAWQVRFYRASNPKWYESRTSTRFTLRAGLTQQETAA